MTDQQTKNSMADLSDAPYSQAILNKLRWLDPSYYTHPGRKVIATAYWDLALVHVAVLPECDQLIITLQRLIDAKDSAVRTAIILEDRE